MNRYFEFMTSEPRRISLKAWIEPTSMRFRHSFRLNLLFSHGTAVEMANWHLGQRTNLKHIGTQRGEWEMSSKVESTGQPLQGGPKPEEGFTYPIPGENKTMENWDDMWTPNSSKRVLNHDFDELIVQGRLGARFTFSFIWERKKSDLRYNARF